MDVPHAAPDDPAGEPDGDRRSAARWQRGAWPGSALRRLLVILGRLLLSVCGIGGAIAVVRFGVSPALDSGLDLGPAASATVRRGLVLVAAVGGYWGYVRWWERRPAAELRPRPLAALLGAVGGAGLIGVTLLVLFAAGYADVVTYRGWGPALGVVGFILVAAVIEELLFRAVLFRLVEEQFGTMAALPIGGVAFGLLHLANEGVGPITALSVTLLGVMWTAVYVVARDLWTVSLHHAAWNLAIFASGLPLSGSEAWRARAPLESTVSGPALLTGGSFGPEDSLISLAVSVAAIVALLWLARRRAPPARG